MPTTDYMAQPVSAEISAFDVSTGVASKDIVFSFSVRGGQQVLGNTLRIYLNNGSTTPIFTSTVTSYVYSQTISTQILYDNGLRNNREYLYTFQTHGRGITGYDAYDEPIYGDIDSAESNPILFKTFQTPVLQFTNMPLPVDNISVIQMANYTFDCQYTQNEGELLSSLYFQMYDYNHALIETSKLYTINDAINPNPSPQTGMLFEYTYQGFMDDTDYYIKAIAATVNNTLVDIETKIHIDYTYDDSYFNIKATNYANGGYVEIVNNVSEIDGEVYDSNNQLISPTYYSDDYIILTNDTLYFKDGYQIPSNGFAKQKWWLPVLLGETTKFYNDTGQYLTLELKRGIKNGICYDYIEVTQHDNMTVRRKTSNLMRALNQTVSLTTYLCVNGSNIDISLLRADNTTYAIWNSSSNIVLDGIYTNLIWDGESGSEVDIPQSYIDIDTGLSNIEWDRLTNMFWGIEGEANREPLAPNLIEYNDDAIISQSSYLHTSLKNAMINEFYVTRNLTQGVLSNFPQWDGATLMLCNFNNNIFAGNVLWLLNSIDGIKLKRKLLNDTTNNWITVFKKDIRDSYDFIFSYRDYYVRSNDTYIYAMIPCSGDDEQSYFYTEVATKFNGLFISDSNQTMKLYSNYGISTAQDNVLIGAIQPYQSIYPIIIKNPYVQYRTATLEGDVLGLNYNADEDNCVQTNFELTDKTRLDISVEAEKWSKFLCNGKTKIIKDWNGNIMMAQVTTPPTRTYDKISGNSKPTMSFGVTEVGQSDNQKDLYKHGLLNIEV